MLGRARYGSKVVEENISRDTGLCFPVPVPLFLHSVLVYVGVIAFGGQNSIRRDPC